MDEKKDKITINIINNGEPLSKEELEAFAQKISKQIEDALKREKKDA